MTLLLIFALLFSALVAGEEITEIQLSPRVLLLQHPPWAETMTVLDAGSSLIVIDTWASPSAASQAEKLLSAHFQKPVSHVINTHHHWDHTFGNQVFSQACIVGHRFCARDMIDEYQSPQLRRLALAGNLSAETPAVIKNYMLRILEETEQGFQLTIPTHLVDDRDSLTVGNLLIKLYHVPGLHTRSNLTIYVPDLGLVFTRREFRQGGLPVLEKDVDMEKLLASLQDILDTGKPIQYLVPGHGQPVRQPDLNAPLSYLRALNSEVRKALNENGMITDVERADVFNSFPQIDTFRKDHQSNVEIVWESLLPR